MAQTGLVIIHHQGAGMPSNSFTFLLKRYSIGIGVTHYDVRRSPLSSFKTGEPPLRALQVCLSGDRTKYAVTDIEIGLIRRAVAEARGHDWITDHPEVTWHDAVPGENTACPGKYVKVRFPEIVAACQAPTATPWPSEWSADVPKPTDVVDVKDAPSGGVWKLTADGGVRNEFGSEFHGSYPGLPGATPKLFYALTVRTDGIPGYTLWAADGSFYKFPEGT